MHMIANNNAALEQQLGDIVCYVPHIFEFRRVSQVGGSVCSNPLCLGSLFT